MVLRQVGKVMALAGGLAVLAACGPGAVAESQSLNTRIVITGSDFKFAPGDITLKVGQTMLVVFRNEGAVDHDWAITDIPVADAHEEDAATSATADAGHAAEADHMHAGDTPDVHVAAASGTTTEMQFTPTVAGQYEIVCTIAGHKEAGMHGTLTVKS